MARNAWVTNGLTLCFHSYLGKDTPKGGHSFLCYWCWSPWFLEALGKASITDRFPPVLSPAWSSNRQTAVRCFHERPESICLRLHVPLSLLCLLQLLPLPFWWMSRWDSSFCCHFPGASAINHVSRVPTKEQPPAYSRHQNASYEMESWYGFLFLFNFILCPSPLTVYLTEFIFSVVPCSKPAQMARLRNPLCSVQRSNVFPIHPFYVYHLFILVAKTVTQLSRKESVSEYGNGPWELT